MVLLTIRYSKRQRRTIHSYYFGESTDSFIPLFWRRGSGAFVQLGAIGIYEWLPLSHQSDFPSWTSWRSMRETGKEPRCWLSSIRLWPQLSHFSRQTGNRNEKKRKPTEKLNDQFRNQDQERANYYLVDRRYRIAVEYDLERMQVGQLLFLSPRFLPSLQALKQPMQRERLEYVRE